MSLKTRHKAQLMLDSSNKIKLGEVYLSGLDGLRGAKVSRYTINQSLSLVLGFIVSYLARGSSERYSVLYITLDCSFFYRNLLASILTRHFVPA